MRVLRSKGLVLLGAIATALMVVGNAFAAADSTVTSAGTSLTTYFSDNIPTVIGAFVSIALAVWLLSILFRTVGAKKPSKVG